MSTGRLNLKGDEPVPSTDEESIFVGKNNAKGQPESDDRVDKGRVDKVEVTLPAPGGGGSYPLATEEEV